VEAFMIIIAISMIIHARLFNKVGFIVSIINAAVICIGKSMNLMERVLGKFQTLNAMIVGLVGPMA
jgi:hypothetical protein